MAHIKRYCRFSSFTKVGVDRNVGYAAKSDTRVEGPWTFGEIPLKMNDKEDRKTRIEKIKSKGLYQSAMDGDVPLHMVPTYHKALGILDNIQP